MHQQGHPVLGLVLVGAALLLVGTLVFPLPAAVRFTTYLIVLVTAPGLAIHSMAGIRSGSVQDVVVVSLGFGVFVTMVATAVMAYGGFWSTEALVLGVAVLAAFGASFELISTAMKRPPLLRPEDRSIRVSMERLTGATGQTRGQLERSDEE